MSRRGQAARDPALSLMSRHNLRGWTSVFNTSLVRAGACFYPTPGAPGRIELSVHFIERNSGGVVRDTILHEIAHALVGRGHGHDEVWRAKCWEIGAGTGEGERGNRRARGPPARAGACRSTFI